MRVFVLCPIDASSHCKCHVWCRQRRSYELLFIHVIVDDGARVVIFFLTLSDPQMSQLAAIRCQRQQNIFFCLGTTWLVGSRNSAKSTANANVAFHSFFFAPRKSWQIYLHMWDILQGCRGGLLVSVSWVRPTDKTEKKKKKKLARFSKCSFF